MLLKHHLSYLTKLAFKGAFSTNSELVLAEFGVSST